MDSIWILWAFHLLITLSMARPVVTDSQVGRQVSSNPMGTEADLASTSDTETVWSYGSQDIPNRNMEVQRIGHQMINLSSPRTRPRVTRAEAQHYLAAGGVAIVVTHNLLIDLMNDYSSGAITCTHCNLPNRFASELWLLSDLLRSSPQEIYDWLAERRAGPR
jgi:hypothetical protein